MEAVAKKHKDYPGMNIFKLDGDYIIKKEKYQPCWRFTTQKFDVPVIKKNAIS
jgi:hypothetical protein